MRTISAIPSDRRRSPCPIIWQTCANPPKLRRLAPCSGYASKCGNYLVPEVAERSSFVLEGPSERDSRIHPHSRNACRSSSSSRSRPFNESEKEGGPRGHLQPWSNREGDAKASFALRQAGHVPGIQPDCDSIDVPILE